MIVKVSLWRGPRTTEFLPFDLLTLYSVYCCLPPSERHKKEVVRSADCRDQRRPVEKNMCCQTVAEAESLYLFTIVIDQVYSPIKVGCFPVSRLCTRYDAKNGWMESFGLK